MEASEIGKGVALSVQKVVFGLIYFEYLKLIVFCWYPLKKLCYNLPMLC